MWQPIKVRKFWVPGVTCPNQYIQKLEHLYQFPNTDNPPEWCRQTVPAGGNYVQHAEDQKCVAVGMKLGKWLSLLVGCCRLLASLFPMILALEQIMKMNSDGIMNDWQPVDWIMKQTLDWIMKQTLDWIINSDQYILIIPHMAIVLSTEAH